MPPVERKGILHYTICMNIMCFAIVSNIFSTWLFSISYVGQLNILNFVWTIYVFTHLWQSTFDEFQYQLNAFAHNILIESSLTWYWFLINQKMWLEVIVTIEDFILIKLHNNVCLSKGNLVILLQLVSLWLT